ncbi:hypothetical protein THAOC_25877, partial [Thalassiosira oceanica]
NWILLWDQSNISGMNKKKQSNISGMNKNKKQPHQDSATANFSSAYVDKSTDEEDEDEIGAI